MALPAWTAILTAILAFQATGVSGALSLPVYQSLDWLVLAIRQHVVGPSLEASAASAPSSNHLETLKQYAPRVQDASFCSSTEGPRCGLFGQSSRPLAADGALYDDLRLTLLKVGQDQIPAMNFNRVNCGSHDATSCADCVEGDSSEGEGCSGDCSWYNGQCRASKDVPWVDCGGHQAHHCSECPQGHGSSWCNGECLWRQGSCIKKQVPPRRSKAEVETVNCGHHRAGDCSACPQGHGAEWCNGDCMWHQDACVLKSNARSVSCGAHTAPDCSKCPQGNGEQWCHGECTWKNGTCVEKDQKHGSR